jgi:hypothetical protein
MRRLHEFYPFRALKGRDIIAQGNALGITPKKQTRALKGRNIKAQGNALGFRSLNKSEP